MNLRERYIIDIAVKAFETETGIKTRTRTLGEQIDVILKVEDQDLILNGEVRLFLNKARLGMVFAKIRNAEGIPLIITRYLYPELRKVIEENRINFIDTAGNAYINVPPLFIKIKGNKPDEAQKIRAARRPFYTAALQTIFTLLCNPGMQNEPVREIADQAGVAHGTAHITIKELEKQGYLLRNNQGYILVNKEDLLERWVTLYPEKLKPKYLAGIYEVKDDLIKELDLVNYNALWGGEEAAARLTKYLRPFIYTIYIGEKRGEFILRNRLRKDPKGNLILMKKFWNFEDYEYQGITHPILVYADLLATGDTRNIETAKIIYEKEIVRYIQED